MYIKSLSITLSCCRYILLVFRDDNEINVSHHLYGTLHHCRR